MYYIDTHSHIYYDKYEDDLDEVINRAQDNNIKNIICVGVDLLSSKKSIKLAESYDLIYATAGYHPHESKDASSNYLNDLEQLLKHKKVVALGEIGLDYYYNHSQVETQLRVFTEQIDLAKGLDMPIIIHNRLADKDLYKTLNNSGIKKGVIHCFSSNLEFAEKIINLGLHISFTGLITFSDDTKEVIKEIPLEKIMIETDSPYLTPNPHRGKRNEHYMVKYVAEKIAEIKNMNLKTVGDITTKTAQKFFGI